MREFLFAKNRLGHRQQCGEDRQEKGRHQHDDDRFAHLNDASVLPHGIKLARTMITAIQIKLTHVQIADSPSTVSSEGLAKRTTRLRQKSAITPKVNSQDTASVNPSRSIASHGSVTVA